MRSIEFFTYLLPNHPASGAPRQLRQKLTRWQAVAWPEAQCLEASRELRWCPESLTDRELIGELRLDDLGRGDLAPR